MRRLAPFLLALSIMAAPAVAHHDETRDYDATVGAIEIQKAWARASVGNGAAYLTLENTGDSVDRLVAVRSPAAGKAEMHNHVMDGDVARMRAVSAIEVHPGSDTVLRPGGLHIMLIGLKKPLKEGDRLPLTLVFEKAGEVALSVPVLKAGSPGPEGGHGASHGHEGGHHMTH